MIHSFLAQAKALEFFTIKLQVFAFIFNSETRTQNVALELDIHPSKLKKKKNVVVSVVITYYLHGMAPSPGVPGIITLGSYLVSSQSSRGR